MPDGRVEFEITADGRKAFATIDDVTEALKKSGQQWEQNAKQSTDKIGSAFKDMFSALALKDVLQNAGKALLDFGKEAISAASDLSEVQNVVDVTFGDNAMVIENWSKNAAAQFGLGLHQPDYHLFVLGEVGSGRASLLRQAMQTAAAERAVPPDLGYLHNFDTPDRPRALRLPAGQGRQLRQGMADMAKNLQADIPKRLAAADFKAEAERIEKTWQAQEGEAFAVLDAFAEARQFRLTREGGQMVFTLTGPKTPVPS